VCYEIEGLKADVRDVRHKIGELKLATTGARKSMKQVEASARMAANKQLVEKCDGYGMRSRVGIWKIVSRAWRRRKAAGR
jgi:hypothetical protein